jgi:hypothetical protein
MNPIVKRQTIGGRFPRDGERKAPAWLEIRPIRTEPETYSSGLREIAIEASVLVLTQRMSSRR